MNDKIEKTLLKDLLKASKKKEVPVAALIVFNNKIIAHAHNARVSKNDVTAHAEVLAIKKAARKLKDWRLNDCDLYVTLEPCSMCSEIIKESRIKNVNYFCERSSIKKGFYKTKFNHLKTSYYDTFQQVLSSFFKDNTNRSAFVYGIISIR